MGTNAWVNIVGGFATFSGLTIKTAGAGYTLKVSARDRSGFAVAQVITPTFSVGIGSIFRLTFNTYISSGTGGVMFDPAPSVALVDRGGNVVSAVQGVRCSVFLSMTPSGREIMYPEDKLTTTFIDGVAVFQGLYINKAGYPYQIGFNASAAFGTKLPILTTGMVEISVGPPYSMALDPYYMISSVPILAGEYWRVAPRLTILDRGANLVVADSSSMVNVSLDSSPKGAVLGPSSSMYSIALAGTVTFSWLKIDLAGFNYRLRYLLSSYSQGRNTFTATKIVALSEYFQVAIGTPRTLSVVVPPGDAMAGGQAFGVQPMVEMRDFGGNLLAEDYTTTATCSMVNSLASATEIRMVDTRGAKDANKVASVTTNLPSGTYGKGTMLIFSVNFKYEVWLTGNSSKAAQLPYLATNIRQASGAPVMASLYGPFKGVKQLQFNYSIAQGDKIPKTGAFKVFKECLNYMDVASLHTGANSIVDGNNNKMTGLLPNPITAGIFPSTLVMVDTNSPYVVRSGLSTTTPDGEYGAGQVIFFNLTYNAPVEVIGDPYLVLSATITNSSGVAYPYAAATFHSVTQSNIVFRYFVSKGDQLHNRTALGVRSQSIRLPSGSSILRRSNVVGTGTVANTSISHTLAPFLASHNITIDHKVPTIDTAYGVQTSKPDGIYYPGEEIKVRIRFTKPVVTSGVSITVYLQSGPPNDPLNGIAILSNNNYDGLHQTLEFTYTVTEACNRTGSLFLDLVNSDAALFVGGGDTTTYIRRQATFPTLDVDVSTKAVYNSGRSLRDLARLQVFGYRPTVQTVHVAGVQRVRPGGGWDLYPDDVVLLRITWTTRVVTTCAPVLIVDTGTYFREAPYYAGNTTAYMDFKYTVQTGDASGTKYNTYQGVHLRYSPNPLCLASGCPTQTKCAMYANSTRSYYPAVLSVPYTTGTKQTGSMVNFPNKKPSNYTINPLPRGRNSSVVAITVSSLYGEPKVGDYGPGTLIYIDVLFTDVAVVGRSTSNGKAVVNYPSLYLNVGRYANYTGGSSTSTLTFLYTSRVGDNIKRLYPKRVPGTSSAIRCQYDGGLGPSTQTCITNFVKDFRLPVNITTTSSMSSFPRIRIDSNYSRVVDVYTDKTTSAFGGYYTVGEIIEIYVKFDLPVVVTGLTPRLQLDFGPSSVRFALYQAPLSLPNVLAFRYIVQEGDMSDDLAFTGSALDLYYNTVAIYRGGDIPTMLANLSLAAVHPRTLGRNGNIIRITTSPEFLPRIQQVVSMTPDGAYYPGDAILMRVDFTQFVVLTGYATLALNLGDHFGVAYFVGTSRTGLVGQTVGRLSKLYEAAKVRAHPILKPNATALALTNTTARFGVTPGVNNTVPTRPTQRLYFLYIVQSGDYSPQLDYVDTFSLSCGVNSVAQRGTLVLSINAPDIFAGSALPVPGTSGSISSTSKIRLEGDTGYMNGLAFQSPPGVYTVDMPMRIQMNISLPVVVTGRPYLLLNTGGVFGTRAAYYESGSGSQSLIFRYDPQPGDYVSNLDYYGVRSDLMSAVESFQLNGGSVLVASARPTATVSIQLSPPGGKLSGTAMTVRAIRGLFTYLDLSIDLYGKDYLLRYSTYSAGAKRTLTTLSTAFVSFSAEFSVRPLRAYANDRVCSSVAVSGAIAVCGAPNSNLSVSPVQTVSTVALFSAPIPEIQVIQMSLVPRVAVQEFHTTADVGETVGGTFRVYFGTVGPSDPIPYNAVEAQMQAFFHQALPAIGNVTVHREPYIFCACNQAYHWTITFHDHGFGPLPPLHFDTAELTGAHVAMVGPTVVQEPAILGGSFAVQYNSPHTGLPRTSHYIPYDATAEQMTGALTALGLNMLSVLVTNRQREGTRMWLVTFDAFEEAYELPPLYVEPSHLTGGLADAWVEVSRPGILSPTGVAGKFSLELRGNTTGYIRYDATAAQMKAALEALPVINAVNVKRSKGTRLNEYTWTIEFVEVNAFTPYGYELQPARNVEPLIAYNALVPAGHTNITVRHSNTAGQQSNPFGPEMYGAFGENAGAVYVFSKALSSGRWVQVARLVGNDTAADSLFGSSVAMQGNSLLVGAMGANMNGLPEVQSLFCAATRGHFRLHFRGWSTDLLSFNISREQLYSAMLSDRPKDFVNLYSMTALDIADWGRGGLCHNNTAVITFFAPWYGWAFGDNDGANIEALRVEHVGLYGRGNASATTRVVEVRRGNAYLDGARADYQQVGAAYLMESIDQCNPRALNYSDCLSGTVWVQRAQFFPIDPKGGERYGAAVAIGNGIAAVGAPGTKNESGLVYVYLRHTGNNVTSWSLAQRMAGLDTAHGDNFGHTIAILHLTMVVGAPMAHAGTGAVYVFNASGPGVPFALQYLVLPASGYVLKAGDLYGYSVAMENNLLVVGCPGREDRTVYLGSTPKADVDIDTGAVFVFQRAARDRSFSFLQRLEGSNVRRRDRFGWSVAVLGRTLAVGAVEDFAGFPSRTSRSSPSPGPSRAVALIQTAAQYNRRKVGTSFRLKWDQTYTRPIAASASAGELAYILQADLNTGPLLVSRSNANLFDGGYVWSVTFLSMDIFANGYNFVPQLSGDGSALTGTNASLTVTFLHPSPARLRGKTHIFQRAGGGYGSLFSEQLFTSPYSYQPVDQCGYAVALRSEYYAMMGCPNRDDAIPGRNTGAALFYDISVLKLQFKSYDYSVTEGKTLKVELKREAAIVGSSDFGDDVLLYVQTLDRNAPPKQQLFVQYKFDILQSELLATQTVLDATGLVGRADGRANYYGSTHNESTWIYGMYDYRGISDYVPFSTAGSFLAETTTLPFPLITTADGIFEKPDEAVSVVLTSPGLWPSMLGRFHTSVTILNSNENYTDSNRQYSKIYDAHPTDSGKLGHAVAVIAALSMSFASAPLASAGSCQRCGRVVASRLVAVHGVDEWVQQGMLTSPLPGENYLFGDALAAGSQVFSTRQNVSLVAVGEPGSNSVHVYSAKLYLAPNSTGISTPQYLWEASLTVPQANKPQHRFGGQGSVALSGCTLLAVGAPGLEAVFLFRRTYHNTTTTGRSGKRWTWSVGEMLRSRDFDYDVIYGHADLHRMEFGKAVASSGRTVAVGAPFADYQKLGTQYVEVNWNTEGTDIVGFGRGKAYTFYSTPPVQLISLESLQPLTEGFFKLSFTAFGATSTCRRIRYNATASAMETALMTLTNIRRISASSSSSVTSEGYRYTWSITFLDFWQEPDLLVPLWSGHGCDASCTAFDSSSAVPSKQLVAARTASNGQFYQTQAVSPSDSRDGNRFGWSVALDGDQLVVGAVYSSSATTTSWDFEVGYLKGWSTTGTAFTYQPTYGDNSKYRVVKEKPQLPSTQAGAAGQTSRLTGFYYVGTYERRPGNSTDYTIADSLFPAGGAQGDGPQGTMTSEVFIIGGSSISFLLGGGCDYYRVYVELIVDGLSLAKHTGQCEERMRRVHFDVSMFRSRAAQIRVVDSSSANWGHISVDDFRFDWDVRGATVNDTAITPILRTSAPPNVITGIPAATAPPQYEHVYNGKDVPGGVIETPQSGAAYAFMRHLSGSFDLCDSDKTRCSWSQEAKLLASDKRPSALFGSSLAVSDSAGIIVVGSPSATLSGVLKEWVPLAHSSSQTDILPTDMVFPLNSQLAPLFQGMPRFTLQASGAGGIWYSEEQLNITQKLFTEKYAEAGSVYVYAKDRAWLGPIGSVDRPQHWNGTEKARIQPPDAVARDYFGGAVSMDGAMLVVGAEGQDGSGAANAGAMYVFNVMFASVSFSRDLYYVVEGVDAEAVVIVNRDLNIYKDELVLQYATSDLSAQGVDAYKYTACFALSSGERGRAHCGDYRQTRGLMTIAAGANSGSFKIPIVNDNCREQFMKYIQLSLSLPGSGALQGGTTLVAMVRIDDDDFIENACSGLS